jgi:ParB family chromosome partitioning protein
LTRKTKKLGKGLGALLPDKPLYEEEKAIGDLVKSIKLSDIFPNKNQPRTGFDQAKLEELSISIKQNGVIQPIVVTPRDNKFMIIAGERRYRAAKLAKIKEIPAIVRDIPEEKVLEFALIENIQREDLLPIEEARALSALVDSLNLSKTDLADRIGKSRSYVSNMIRLLELPKYVLNLLEEEKLSVGHARALLTVEDEETIIELSDQIVKKGLNVRQVEKLVKKLQDPKKEREVPQKDIVKSLIIKEFEESLQSNLKTKVEIKNSGEKGCIVIDYYSNEDLERIMEKLNKVKV